jgi:hypothetical protein
VQHTDKHLPGTVLAGSACELLVHHRCVSKPDISQWQQCRNVLMCQSQFPSVYFAYSTENTTGSTHGRLDEAVSARSVLNALTHLRLAGSGCYAPSCVLQCLDGLKVHNYRSAHCSNVRDHLHASPSGHVHWLHPLTRGCPVTSTRKCLTKAKHNYIYGGDTTWDVEHVTGQAHWQ